MLSPPGRESGDEAARVHQGSWRCGDNLVVRGTGTTARTDPAPRHPLACNGRRCGISDLDCRVLSSVGGFGLEHSRSFAVSVNFDRLFLAFEYVRLLKPVANDQSAGLFDCPSKSSARGL
jgi:hypothetical protein